MGVSIAVAGASGYAGGELLRILTRHPHVELASLQASTQAGQRIGAVHPHLVSLADRVLEPTDPAVLGEADVVFLALPHGHSAAVASALPPTVTILDLGADFRLVDAAAWERFYGGAHAGTWPYGLPELPGQRAALAGERRIALPGCYATAMALALAPLLAAGLVEPTDVVVSAMSGTTGAGRTPTQRLLGSEVMGDLTTYKVGAHQHVAEVRQALSAVAGAPVTLSFTPGLAPLPRGILATCSARAVPGVTIDELRAALAYSDEPFVTLLPVGTWPHTKATLGSGSCHLGVTLDADAGRVIVCSALDNIGKGAAAQAVQVLNLVQGWPETTGIDVDGTWA